MLPWLGKPSNELSVSPSWQGAISENKSCCICRRALKSMHQTSGDLCLLFTLLGPRWTVAMFSFGSIAIDYEQMGADGVICMERGSSQVTPTQLLLFPRENLVTPPGRNSSVGHIYCDESPTDAWKESTEQRIGFLSLLRFPWLIATSSAQPHRHLKKRRASWRRIFFAPLPELRSGLHLLYLIFFSQ